MSKITESARGADCTVRLIGCNRNNETTVFAHLSGIRFGHGVGKKVSDLHGAYCCGNCHNLLDGRVKNNYYTKDELKLAHLEAVIETQIKLIDKGLL